MLFLDQFYFLVLMGIPDSVEVIGDVYEYFITT